MEIYERIKLLHKEYLKLTQDDLDEHLGVNRDTISKSAVQPQPILQKQAMPTDHKHIDELSKEEFLNKNK